MGFVGCIGRKGNIAMKMIGRAVRAAVKIERKKHHDKGELRVIEKSELFDGEWYKKTYLQHEHIDPARHFMLKGWKLGYNPSPWFCTNDYLARYHDIRDAQVNPLYHYETVGKGEFRNIQCVR